MSDELIKPIDMNRQTYNVYIDLWLNNIRQNFNRVRNEAKLQDLPHRKGEPCILIGGGPSLTFYKHLEMIAKAGWKHPVLCSDRMFASALKLGIKPYLVATIDATPLIAKFYKDPLIKQHRNDTEINVAFGVATNPLTVKAWKGKIWWFVPALDDFLLLQRHSITYVITRLLGHEGAIAGVGNVGGFLWNMAAELECSPIILVGYDLSEQVKDKAEAVYWKPMVHDYLTQIMKKKKHEKPTEEDAVEAQDAIAKIHDTERNLDFIADRDFLPYYKKGEPVGYLVNPVWKSYRDMLINLIRSSKIHTINSTGNGCLTTQAVAAPNFEAIPLEKALEVYN